MFGRVLYAFDRIMIIQSHPHFPWRQFYIVCYCEKTVRIRKLSGPHFPASRLNTERHSVSLRIQSECEKMRAKKILNTDTFLGVYFYVISFSILQIHVSKIFFWWKRWSSCKRLILLVPLISLVIRQKGEWQNVCFKKTKHTKFSEKRTFLTS